MSLEFKPSIKSINIASEDLTKITLEVKNDSLNGKYDELRKLSGKTVLIAVIPETYTYIQEFDTSTKKPITEWIINADGTAEIRKTEQTQLDVDGQGNIDIKRVEKKVDKDLIDQYIMASSTLILPDDVSINPRDVIIRLNDGEDLGSIADDYEMSDSKLLNELEKSRQHFAPFADYWDKHKEDILFPDEAEENDTETEHEDGDDDLENKLSIYPQKGENVSEEKTEGEN
ncbi:hypothetical protein [Enterococcus olivae]